jgi:hypothetical protein
MTSRLMVMPLDLQVAALAELRETTAELTTREPTPTAQLWPTDLNNLLPIRDTRQQDQHPKWFLGHLRVMEDLNHLIKAHADRLNLLTHARRLPRRSCTPHKGAWEAAARGSLAFTRAGIRSAAP